MCNNLNMPALLNSLLQIGIFVGLVYLVGFLISLINKAFYSLAGATPAVIYGTGFIGTPIHELSHAFFCLVFGHKINEIKLFQIGDEDGTLGYVNHSYNKRNIYHQIGNFFIGTAPILVGTVFLMLMMWLITPTTFGNINGNIDAFVKGGLTFNNIFQALWGCIVSFFKGVTDWRWWLYIILVLFVAIHMNLSKADLDGSYIAIPFIVVIIFIVNFIVWAIPGAYDGFLSVMSKAEAYVIVTLFMSLVFSIVSLVPAAIIYFIRRGIHR